MKEKDLYAERGPVVGTYQIGVADLSLMDLMSQESPIWHEVQFHSQHPTYVPITWTDIASFAARQSVKKYHGNDAMNEKLYMNITPNFPVSHGKPLTRRWFYDG